MCGGNSNINTCILLSDGNWNVSHHLLYPRYSHKSWVRPDGAVLLIGGEDFSSMTTTEVLTEDGGSARSFNLIHRSRYVDSSFVNRKYILYNSFVLQPLLFN